MRNVLIKKIYNLRSRIFSGNSLAIDFDLNATNGVISKSILDSRPCLISRFGNVELDILLNYKNLKDCNSFMRLTSRMHSILTGYQPCYWKAGNLTRFGLNAGFFPLNHDELVKFSSLIIGGLHRIDILASWIPTEKYLRSSMVNAKITSLDSIEPFFSNNPWTHALAGKRVLIIHPFERLIIEQFKRKNEIFPNGMLPDFELITLKSVQSAGGAESSFSDWFEALESMKIQIERIDFDVAIIGAGAYGMPLGFFVKDLGKIAIHMGGVTQLIFGINGSRWSSNPKYASLFNDCWTFPGEEFKPPLANEIENSCYW